MKKIRTFIDAGVLIAAARGDQELSERAMTALDDPAREYMSSDFVRLEVFSKAVFQKNFDEVEFYNVFFAAVRRMVRSSASLVREAQIEAERAGLSAVDALRVAAARRANAVEFVTVEKQQSRCLLWRA